MLQAILIGNIGADAQLQNKDGKEFTTFRVAHNDSWNDQAGNKHESSLWVDCIMNGKPNVLPYLKKGQQVFITGTVKLRIYSSEKDRCMKPGLTVNVSRVELLGGSTDIVPSRLYDKNGAMHDVTKYYLTDIANAELVTLQGKQFLTDANGWVFQPQTDNESQHNGQQESDATQQRQEPIDDSTQQNAAKSKSKTSKSKSKAKNNEPDRKSDDAPAF